MSGADSRWYLAAPRLLAAGLRTSGKIMTERLRGTARYRTWCDSAKVVWAREIPGVEIEPLLKYFASYHIWLMEPRSSPPDLTPFHTDR
jgi:hypothetical protein